MALEDVIAGAIAEAREDGLEGAQAGDEPVIETGDEDAGDGDGAETAADENAEGDSGETKDGEGDGAEKEGDENADENAEGEGDDKDKPKEGEDKPKEGTETEEEKLLKELGLKPRADGRVHRIPVPRVAKMVGKARLEAAESVKTVVATVGKALGVSDAELTEATFETLAPKLTEALSDVSELRQRVSVMDELAPIMLTNGDAFVTMLAKSNPEQYAKFLAVLDEGFEAPERRELPEEKNDPKPAPDLEVTLPNGQKGKTYSNEQHEKLLDWQERKSERKFNAALEKRFKPLDDQQKAAQSQEARQQALINDMNDFMADAMEWKGFKDHKDEILVEVKKIDKKVPFRRATRMAYETVVFGKLHTDRTKMRGEIHAELKKAPAATGVKKTGGAVKKADTGVVRGEGGEVVTGTEAAIRLSLQKAKSAGLVK
jgi:hypothetical protein